MSHTNPLPERLRASADEVQSFPHPTFCDHLHVAHDVMREAAAALEAYDLGARSTAAQPVEQPSTMHDTTGTQALWPQMIAALAAIDAELGLPEDGCNSLTQTLAAIRKLKAAPPAASGGISSLSADGDPAARVELPTRTLMERRGIAAMASQQTSTSVANEGAGCVETLAGSRPTVSTQQCNAAASGDSTPASLEVHMDREHGGLAFGKGDPSGALRPEPEAVGQGRWWRKKPVVIEAFQWNGLESGCQAAKARFPELETSSKSGHLRRPEVTSWHIRTLEGHMRVSPGDWIVRGVAGEFYPCKPDIFAATYEPAEPPQAASVERGD